MVRSNFLQGLVSNLQHFKTLKTSDPLMKVKRDLLSMRRDVRRRERMIYDIIQRIYIELTRRKTINVSYKTNEKTEILYPE